MSSITLVKYIFPAQLDFYWPHISGYIQAALNHTTGELDLEDVRERLYDETMRLLVITCEEEIIAASVVEMINYPNTSALRVVTLGGVGMNDWIEDFVKFLVRWGLELGVDRLEHSGRDGWVRVLEKLGYRKRYVFMTKDLKNG